MSSKTPCQESLTVLAIKRRFAGAEGPFRRPQLSAGGCGRREIFEWRQPLRQTAGLMLMLTSLSIIGCGPTSDGLPRAAVNGFVTFDGEPLKAGVIRFIPSFGSEGPKVSVAIVKGFFCLTEESGPVVGEHRIEIEAPAAGGLAFDDEEALQRLRQSGRKVRLEVIRIPAVYNLNSRLQATILKDGPNDLTFELFGQTSVRR